MREQGFEYIAADSNTGGRACGGQTPSPASVRRSLSSLRFGVSTFYTGLPPQLSTDYSPARVGLGERNVQIFRKLPPPIRSPTIARCLGEDLTRTFAVALETKICRVPVAARARPSLKRSSPIS
jgi:hypothetical protein